MPDSGGGGGGVSQRRSSGASCQIPTVDVYGVSDMTGRAAGVYHGTAGAGRARGANPLRDWLQRWAGTADW